jgi:hypothetical protein
MNTFSRFITFIKYNNFAIILIMIVFVVGSSVLAAPLAKTTRVEGVDNTLLISTDLDKMLFNYKVEKIESDDIYYYVTYTHNNLTLLDGVWQEINQEDTLKVTKSSLDEDLGVYLARQLSEEQMSRLAELKTQKEKALVTGPEKRVEVTEYSGLIGKALNSAGTMFPGYEPIVEIESPSPEPVDLAVGEASTNDSIVNTYQTYIAEHQDLFGSTTQIISSSSTGVVIPDTSSSTVTDVKVIELPVDASTSTQTIQ